MSRRTSLPRVVLWISISLPACNGCSCGPNISPSCSLGDSSSSGGGCGSGGGGFSFGDAGRPDGLGGTWVDSGTGNPMPGGVVLKTLASQPRGLAMLDGTIYVVDGDSIRRAFVEPPSNVDAGIPLDASSDADLDASSDAPDDAPHDAAPDAPDGGPSDVLAMGIGDVEGLGGWGDYLFWARHAKGSTAGAIVRMRVRPWVDAPEDIAPSSNALEGVAADSTGVRWLEDMEGLYFWDGVASKLVVSAPVATTARFSPLARGTDMSYFVAQDQVVSLADDGNWSATMLSGALGVAVDGTSLFTARSTSSGVEVGSVTKNGFTSFASFGDVRAMRVAALEIFVADEARSVVARATFQSSMNIALPNQPPHDLVVSASWVYFTTVGSPSDVRRVAR